MEIDHTPLVQDERRVENAPPGFGTRHILAAMSFLGFVNIYALRVNLSVALVAMVNHTNVDHSAVSQECPQNITPDSETGNNYAEFNWDHNTQSFILGAFFYGYMVTQVPGGWLAERFGGKLIFGFGILCASVLTLVTPLAARWSMWALVGVRIIEGIGEGVTYPAMHAMWGNWAPVLERSRLCAFCYSGSQIGMVIAMPFSGLLSASDLAGGWPSVFYVFGTIGCIWFLFWMILIHDTPGSHPRISSEEKIYVERSIGHNKNKSIPWVAIFTSPALIAILVAHFTSNWGLFTLLTGLPTYMKEILNFNITQNGFLSALPYLLCWVVNIVAGGFADFLRETGYLSTTSVRKLFNTLGNFFAALFLLLIPFAGCSVGATFAMIVLAVGLSGFHVVGYEINHIDIAPNYAGTLMGITNTFAAIPGVIGPSVVGILTNADQNRGQWRIVFYITAGMYIFGMLFYLCFAKGDVQEWAITRPEDKNFKQDGVYYGSHIPVNQQPATTQLK